MSLNQIQYSEKYRDDKYEYRHVILPVDLARHVPKTHLMSETEWRNLAVQQSPGWVHYMMHVPEPHVLLFRRPRTDVLTTTRTAPFRREYQSMHDHCPLCTHELGRNPFFANGDRAST